jgi:hypothetical protein
MPIAPPLSVVWGYGIILGLGAIFAFGMQVQPLPKPHVPSLTGLDPRNMVS